MKHPSGVLSAVEANIDYIENQTRCFNLQFEGLKKSMSEMWNEMEAKLNKIIVDQLKLLELYLKRAPRVGKQILYGNASMKLRTIIAYRIISN